MSKKVFVSYSHAQKEWVADRLVSCLRAGGAEPLVDLERFTAGRGLVGQMDETQDLADVQVLVLSPQYLESKPCRHEMDRAIALDPDFRHGFVVPVVREPCSLPEDIWRPEPLYVDLADDRDPNAWDKLLAACGADLGIDAPVWLTARDQTRRYLERRQSVNLVVTGREVAWEPLLGDLRRGVLSGSESVDLLRGRTASRRGLVEEILRVCGGAVEVPEPPEDLVVLDHTLSARPASFLVLEHFHLAAGRSHYGIDLFATLRDLIERDKLTLLVQSRQAFGELVPHNPDLSGIESLVRTVRLEGRP